MNATAGAAVPDAPPLNRLIERLAPVERRRFLAGCEAVQLRPGDWLSHAGTLPPHVYFPEVAFVALVIGRDAGESVEVGLVGNEGMVGATQAMGAMPAPWAASVQGGGAAWRIGAPAFRRALAQSSPLRHGIDRYLGVRFAQMAQAAGCIRHHALAPRLARWLLMCHDRAHADHFHVTHETLAGLLGVRRVGITAAAGALQRDGLIDYHRGEISVRQRAGLEHAACRCYAEDRRVYDQQFG